MPTATIAAALKMHRTVGIERGIIVQATTYGADHKAVLDGLAAAGRNYRGCANAIVFEEADDSYLDKLHAAGIRGARFTRQGLGVALAPEAFARAIARVKELRWYAKFQPEPDGLVGPQIFENLDIPVIIDHMGRANAANGTSDPTVVKILELLKRGNFWVMLSLSEKLSRTGEPWDDVVPIARAFIEAAPNRVIWASDWPHPLSKTQPPNEGALLDLFHRFTANDEERRRILVYNPAVLFGFDR
jgi:predicted TIM-barrel fold metal-dependent hydrolase